MNEDARMQPIDLKARMFRWLLLAVSIAFVWVILPFYGAVLWGVVLALVFMPVQRWLLMRVGPRRRTLAAVLVLLLMLAIVVLPMVLISASLVQEISRLAEMIQTRQFDPARELNVIVQRMPSWLRRVLDMGGLADLEALQGRLSNLLAQGSQAAARYALGLGQNTLDWLVGFTVALYLAFFLLRDGNALSRRIYAAIPLSVDHKRTLFTKLATVLRATVKGNVVVAVVQGALGGLALWFLDVRGALLWAVLMAVLSLLPAVGAALVWLPVALWFMASGHLWQGVGLIAWGVLVIGLVDNVLRPLLVGKDTRIPDYVVLVTTIGGMALLGINGFVVGPTIAAMFIAVWEIFANTPDDAIVQAQAVVPQGSTPPPAAMAARPITQPASPPVGAALPQPPDVAPRLQAASTPGPLPAPGEPGVAGRPGGSGPSAPSGPSSESPF